MKKLFNLLMVALMVYVLLFPLWAKPKPLKL
mgnify:CR=1 FL=1